MAFTRILGPGIHTASNINSHNINSTGIITAVSFVGNLTGGASSITGTPHVSLGNVNAGIATFTGALSGTTANFSGNVTVGGVLTYEDVKNVDSVGIVTAREGIFIPSTKKLEFGGTGPGSSHFQIHHNGSNSIIEESGPGGVQIHAGNFLLMNDAGTEKIIRAFKNGDVELYFDDSQKFATTNTGAQVFGTLSGASEVGIQSGGVQIGAGITQLNFVGTGNTFAVNGTTVDISISGGSAGAGGTWSTYTAGIATSKSVGVNTSNLDDNDLVGVGNSFQGLYISNGMLIHDNSLNGNHYIGTSMCGLMAGPVNIEGTLSIDGNYVVV